MQFRIKTYDLETDLRDVITRISQANFTEGLNKDFVKSYWYKILIDQDPGGNLKNTGFEILLVLSNSVSGSNIGSKTLAFSVLHRINKTIELIMVSSFSRGLGIGSKVLEECIRRGYTRLDVHVENHGAIKLYKKMNFKSEDYSGDFIRMKLNQKMPALSKR